MDVAQYAQSPLVPTPGTDLEAYGRRGRTAVAKAFARRPPDTFIDPAPMSAEQPDSQNFQSDYKSGFYRPNPTRGQKSLAVPSSLSGNFEETEAARRRDRPKPPQPLWPVFEQNSLDPYIEGERRNADVTFEKHVGSLPGNDPDYYQRGAEKWKLLAKEKEVANGDAGRQAELQHQMDNIHRDLRRRAEKQAHGQAFVIAFVLTIPLEAALAEIPLIGPEVSKLFAHSVSEVIASAIAQHIYGNLDRRISELLGVEPQKQSESGPSDVRQRVFLKLNDNFGPEAAKSIDQIVFEKQFGWLGNPRGTKSEGSPASSP